MIQGVERTRAVASFFRDASLSSSDSVMVTVALALDTPRLSPLVTAWEKESAGPEAAPHEVDNEINGGQSLTNRPKPTATTRAQALSNMRKDTQNTASSRIIAMRSAACWEASVRVGACHERVF